MEKILRVERAYEDGAEYRYELISEEMSEERVGDVTRYSIRVKMSLCQNKTEATTDFIFTSLERASEFYSLLKKNLVTPLNLEYVIEDERVTGKRI